MPPEATVQVAPAAVEAAAQAVEAAASDSTNYLDQNQNEAHFKAAMDAALKVAPLDDGNKTAIAVQEKHEAEAIKEAEGDEEAPVEQLEAEAKDDEEEAPVEEPKGALAKARRLFQEGEIEAALDLVGIPLDKVNPTTKQWKAVKRYITEAKEESTQKIAEAEANTAEVRRIATNLAPLAHGAQAYKNGDIALFLKLTTGDSPEEFQRKLIAQLHTQPAAVDPRIAARLEQLERERQTERTEAQKIREQNEQLQAQQAEGRWYGEMAAELGADPTYTESPGGDLSKADWFLREVLQTQKDNTNFRTKMTLSHSDAAELVYSKFYGATPRPAGGKTGSNRADRVNSAQTGRGGLNGASKKTAVNTKQSTEAAPVDLNGEYSPEKQEQLLEHYIRIAKSELRA